MLFQNLSEEAQDNARMIFAEMTHDIINEIRWEDGVFQEVHFITEMLGIHIEQDEEDFHNDNYVFSGTFQPDPDQKWRIDNYIKDFKLTKYDPRYVFLDAYKKFLKGMFPHKREWYRWLHTFTVDYDLNNGLECDESVKAILEDFCQMVVYMLQEAEEWQFSDDAIEQAELDWTENGELAEFDDDVYLPDPPAEIIISA